MYNSTTSWTIRLLCPWKFSRQEYWSELPFPSPMSIILLMYILFVLYTHRTHTHTQETVVVVVQSLNHVWLFETPWTEAQEASLTFTISQSLLKLMCIESVMPSNHLIRKESDIFGAPCVQYEKAHSGCSRNVELLFLHLPFPYCRLHDCGAAHKHLEGGLAHSGSTARNCWTCSSRTKIYPSLHPDIKDFL